QHPQKERHDVALLCWRPGRLRGANDDQHRESDKEQGTWHPQGSWHKLGANHLLEDLLKSGAHRLVFLQITDRNAQMCTQSGEIHALKLVIAHCFVDQLWEDVAQNE